MTHKISALVIFSRMKKVEDEEDWTLFQTSCFPVELLWFNGGEAELISSYLSTGDTKIDSVFAVLTNTLVIFICLSFTEAAFFLCFSLFSWLFKAVEPILLSGNVFFQTIHVAFVLSSFTSWTHWEKLRFKVSLVQSESKYVSFAIFIHN